MRSKFILFGSILFIFLLKMSTGQEISKNNEQLIYSLHFGIFKAGIAKLETKDTITSKGEQYTHIFALGRSTGFVNALYRVYDIYESFIEPETMLPARSIRNIREGNYRYYNEVFFQRDSHRIYSQRSGYWDAPHEIHDILSAFHYLRKELISPGLRYGDTITIETFFSDEFYPLRIRYMGTDKVEIGLGKFRCYKFVPIVEVGRLFRDEDDMRIWISKDDNKIPILIEFDIKVGSFVCELIEFKNNQFHLRKPQ